MIFLNEIEGEELTGQSHPEMILNTLSEQYENMNIVLTLGSDGAYFKNHEQVIFQESYKVDVCDTTAAGDTFSGYFLACFIKGNEVADCMRYASKAASIAVTRPGAGESIPHWSEVWGEDN